MKEKITYEVECRRCHQRTTYVLRDTNVNPMSDKDVHHVLMLKKQETHGFHYCEYCEMDTKNEIISFDYLSPSSEDKEV